MLNELFYPPYKSIIPDLNPANGTEEKPLMLFFFKHFPQNPKMESFCLYIIYAGHLPIVELGKMM